MKISNEFKIGLASLVAVVVLYIGINFLKGISLLHHGEFYYVKCPDVTGLNVSSHVLASGYQIGLVRSMEYATDGSGDVVVKINIKEPLDIPSDSYAAIEADILGTSSLIIKLGHERTFYTDGDTIAGGLIASGMLDEAKDMMPGISALLPKIDTLIGGLNVLVNESELQSTLINMNQISAQLKQTTTQLNRFMNGSVPTILANAESATARIDTLGQTLQAAQIDRTLAKVDTALDGINALLQQLNSENNSLGLLANTTQLHDELQRTIASADSLFSDIKANPKRYINVSVFGGKK